MVRIAKTLKWLWVANKIIIGRLWDPNSLDFKSNSQDIWSLEFHIWVGFLRTGIALNCVTLNLTQISEFLWNLMHCSKLQWKGGGLKYKISCLANHVWRQQSTTFFKVTQFIAFWWIWMHHSVLQWIDFVTKIVQLFLVI